MRQHVVYRNVGLLCFLLGLILQTVACDSRPISVAVKTRPVFQEFHAKPNNLKAIRQRGRLRIITHFQSMEYFLAHGYEQGFEYDLARTFANELGVEVEAVLPPSRSAMQEWLRDGGGDLIISAQPLNQPLLPGLVHSRPYRTLADAVVVRRQDATWSSIDKSNKLKGKSVSVVRKSLQYDSLLQLQQQGVTVRIHTLADDHSDHDLLESLASGLLSAVAVDEAFARQALRSHYHNLKIAFRLKSPRKVAWILPQGAPKLRKQLNRFLKRHYFSRLEQRPRRSAHYNILYRHYFNHKHHPLWTNHAGASPKGNRLVSAYDHLVKKSATEYGLDWRLLLAVIYEESRFNPQAISPAGAKGLMQLIPTTFASFGRGGIFDTEENIRAGAAYIKWLFRLYRHSDLAEEEQIRLVLASYNAGMGHLQDARRLAAEFGWNKDRWHGGIKQALQLLMDEKYYAKVRHGFCRGSETLTYVRRIMERYRLFKKFITL